VCNVVIKWDISSEINPRQTRGGEIESKKETNIIPNKQEKIGATFLRQETMETKDVNPLAKKEPMETEGVKIEPTFTKQEVKYEPDDTESKKRSYACIEDGDLKGDDDVIFSGSTKKKIKTEEDLKGNKNVY